MNSNRADLARQGLFWDSVAEAAREKSRAARAALTEAAVEEFERDGCAPTWRIPGIGTVPLALTSSSVAVVDGVAFLEWVAARYPDEIEHTPRVRPAFADRLLKAAVKLGDPPSTADGEVIPGLTFRPGGQPRGIQIRPDADAKEAAAELAQSFLDERFGEKGAA